MTKIKQPIIIHRKRLSKDTSPNTGNLRDSGVSKYDKHLIFNYYETQDTFFYKTK